MGDIFVLMLMTTARLLVYVYFVLVTTTVAWLELSQSMCTVILTEHVYCVILTEHVYCVILTEHVYCDTYRACVL